MDLGGSRAIVTGASYGIGAAMARSLARRGVRVVLVARSEDRLSELAQEIEGVALAADLAVPSDLDGLVGRAEAASGGAIDLLVNNAASSEIGPFPRRHADDIAREVQVNLTAVLQLTQQVLPGMVERNRGHIVFMSSLQAAAPTPGFAVYGATKAAVSHFAAILRLELAGTSIGITVVAPGPVDTPLWDRIEASSYTTAILHRYAQARLLTKDDPSVLADKVSDAIARNRRHVRTPRRALALNLLSEAPRRMTEALLTGVQLDPPSGDAPVPRS
jgi:short-subunit dehydrogenase